MADINSLVDGDNCGDSGRRGRRGRDGREGPPGPSQSLIYRPGSGLTGPTVFDTWPDLIARLTFLRANSNGSGVYQILFDDSIVTPASIPAGTYDMTNVTWAGDDLQPTTALVNEGVVLERLRHLQDLGVAFTGTTPPVSDFTAPLETFELDGAAIVCVGAGPFIRITSPGSATIALHNKSTLVFGTTQVIDAATFLQIPAVRIAGFAGSLLASDTISGVPTAVAELAWFSTSASLSEAQPALTGAGGLVTTVNETRERQFSTPIITANTNLFAGTVARVNTSIGPVTVTLPQAFNNRGVSIVIKDVGGQSAANNITIAAPIGSLIDGGLTAVLATNRGAITVTSDGASNWMITTEDNDLVIASASVISNGTVLSNSGFASIIRTGLGNYTCTLLNAPADDDVIPTITMQSATGVAIPLVTVIGGQILVSTIGAADFGTAVASDRSFYITVSRGA